MTNTETSKKLSPQEANTPGEAAARWWTSVLRDGPKFDNGAELPPIMQVVMSLSEDYRPEYPDDSLSRFEAILAHKLDQSIGGDYASYGISFGVDYHPDAFLEECARQAGIFREGVTEWPWKTHMWVKPDEVSVRYGYGAEREVIWKKRQDENS
ncbi:MAG: hypothetical protein CSA81_13745 [Acidobacteria bacterium]|nr:MAG: hypothetical protein CSA81_13745 [Acidobacteriota bacterium]